MQRAGVRESFLAEAFLLAQRPHALTKFPLNLPISAAFRRQVLGFKTDAVGREDELRLCFSGRRALPQRPQRVRDLVRVACRYVNVIGLKNTAEVGLVRGARAEPLDRRVLVAERFEESIRKVRRVKRLIRQLRDGLFNFNRVQLAALPT